MVRRAVLLLAVTVLALAGAATAWGQDPVLNVHVDTEHPPGPQVPPDFLGLSYEAGALPTIAGFADRGNLVGYLNSLGTGSLRFGGVTVDTQAAWSDDGRIPAWANTAITRADMVNLGRLASATDWSVLLGLGLGHYDPDAASREVAAATASLGTRLAGIEIANEPHAFAHQSLRSDPWGFPDYQTEVDAYRAAIAARTPGIPLVGPDVGSGSGDWLRGEAMTEHPRALTVHYYSLGCHGAIPPQATDLMSHRVREQMKGAFYNFARISQANWLPFRIGEANNVSCGGKSGVSETFASALWALDFGAQAMSNGLAGINLHGSIFNCHGYTPLCAKSRDDLAAGKLTANPEWYALLMLRELIGDKPLISWMSPHHSNVALSAWTSSRGRMHILLIEDGQPGSPHLNVRLRVPPRFRSGSLLRLTAPDPTATDGVTLGGQAVNDYGIWSAPASLPRLAGSAGGLSLRLAPASAVLVTLFSHP